ncbi:MAG: polymerase, sigma-24 subunit, subfamily [Gemmatimonadetes bacterium]|nr:polymerase, sigma-24 subunit, subfamily [Gemmatimonadota bacterium]
MADRPESDSLTFRGLFETHADALRRYAYRLVRSREQAEDVVQDVFFRLWRTWDRIDIGTGTRSYLYATTRSRALDYIRHVHAQERRQMNHIRLIADDEPAERPDDETRVGTEDLARAIEHVLAQMPPRQREVAALRLRHQLTTKDIAERMAISPRTVEVHVARATRALREQLPALLADRRPVRDGS